jgi:lipoprotein-anchoring transpeptidase ErfK/SrfK
MASRLERQQRRRTTRQRAIGGAVALAVIVAASVLVLTSGGAEKKRATPTTTTTVKPGDFSPVTTLTSALDELIVYEAPDASAPEVTRLNELTRYGVVRTLLMTGTVPGWYEALLPIRPNGTKGWVKAEEVTTATSDYEIRVSLSKHKLKLFEQGEKILESDVVIGKPETPTPLGSFYVTDPVNLSTRRGSDYGAFALGISGFSEVLSEFEDGPGQLAVHGTPRPEEVGQDLSNGCVRVPDDVILKMAEIVPLGTPVNLVA